MMTLLLNDDQKLIDRPKPLNVARNRETATMLPIYRGRLGSRPVPSQTSVLTIENDSPLRDILGRLLSLIVK